MIRLTALVLTFLSIPLSASVPLPKAISAALPGLWEVSQSARGSSAQRVCLRDVRLLAQWEHRARPCTQQLLSDAGTSAVISYRCAGADFGQSKMTLITPRTMRVETQGIAGSYPFQYTLHARRLGTCPSPR